MKKRAAGTGRKQEKTPVAMSVAMQQLMLPLLLAMDATKKGLLSFVQQMGMVALSELLATEAAMIAGPKGKHIEGRTHHHWGTGTTPVCFGGRNVSLPHPRVRVRGQGRGAEVTLPSVEALRDGDPMSDRVAEQIALGVSTRGYDRSLEPVDESIETRGTSKSNASRALIDATTEKLAHFVSRKLDDVDLVAMFIDGIEFAGHAVLIALGVTIDGTKTPLGIWAGSTENTVVQRCQVHKARNVRDHLPESRRAYVAKQMRDAYDSATAATAKKKLMQLASWLDANGEDGAAASLREGLDETLTVLRLNLPAALRRTFATTNPIENMNGSLRRIARNVKRWKDEAMIRRWVALGIAEAQKGFRRVKGYVHMPSLVTALRPDASSVASEKKVA